MFQLYGYPTQNSLKVLYTLEELQCDYKFQLIDLMKRENRTDEFLALNPFGKVPLLVTEQGPLSESGAICRYLANQAQSSLYPTDYYQRALVDQWIDFFSIHLGRWLSTLFYEKIIKAKANLGGPDTEAVDEAMRFSQRQLALIDTGLTSTDYFVGDALTIADLFAFAYIEQCLAIDYDLSQFPAVQSWLEKIGQRSSINAARSRFEQ